MKRKRKSNHTVLMALHTFPDGQVAMVATGAQGSFTRVFRPPQPTLQVRGPDGQALSTWDLRPSGARVRADRHRLRQEASMDITILIWINTLVLLAVVVLSLREVRQIATIQRALFLQLRRQYQDIDRDLQEIRDLLQKEA